MGLSKERKNQTARLKEVLNGEAVRTYEFPGPHGPVIGIHGVFGAWFDGGIKNYMLQNNIGGSLVHLGTLIRGLETYLPDIEDKIEEYPNALILGYSVGGILALKYAQHRGWNNFRKIIKI